MPAQDKHISRDAALAILRVKAQTLYSYVSRGLIRRVSKPDGRGSLYIRADVLKVRSNSMARSGHGPAAAAALYRGAPVIQTAITEVTEDGPRYRRFLATDLASSGASFEAVAEYLWTGCLERTAGGWTGARMKLEPLAPQLARRSLLLNLLPQTILCAGAIVDEPPDADLPLSITLARALMRALAGAIGYTGPSQTYVPLRNGERLAEGILRQLGVRRNPSRVAALNAAMVALADHEFSSSTFVARVTASRGASMAACLAAALNVHSGSGRRYDDLCRLIGRPLNLRLATARIAEALGSGRDLPGFNHALYSGGDPRVSFLLSIADRVNAPDTRALLALIDAARSRFEISPTAELGLVAICRALRMPDNCVAGIFAVARSAGWVAHIIEQRTSGLSIRPRAEFAAPE